MIILDTVDRSLELILPGAITTNQVVFISSYVNITTITYVPGENNGLSNNGTAVTIVAAPGISVQRQVKLLTVYNNDTVQQIVTIRLNDTGTFRTLIKITLDVGSTLVYTDGEGFRVINSSGQVLGVGATGATGPSGSNSYPGPPGLDGLDPEEPLMIIGPKGDAGNNSFTVGREIIAYLGGNRIVGILAAIATDAINWIDVEINGTAYLGWTFQARIEVRTTDVATSVTPRIQNVTDATTAGTGVSCTATDIDYSGVNQKQTITLTLTAGIKKYRLQLTPGNADTDVYGIGYLELIAP